VARTITWDQGKEVAFHAEFTVATGIPVYVCDPHKPWQRGSNANTNRLLRQYLPKGTDLSVHSAADLARIDCSLNNRPRKTLGYLTPSERLAEFLLRTPVEPAIPLSLGDSCHGAAQPVHARWLEIQAIASDEP
jgi:transposase, IS30 family